jgi:fructose-specific component phosphotransferase system IIB-like protein
MSGRLSNYPNGFADGIAISGVPILNTHSGNVWWVDYNNGNDGNTGKLPNKAFKTADYAVGKCTANKGDIIIAMPGHTETITASNTLTFDVAGVTVMGLGAGNDRPKFTVGTDAAATITVSGASVCWRNLVVVGALDGLNTAVTVTGDDADLDFEYRDTSSTVEADIAVACTGDRLKLKLRDIGFNGDQRDQSVTLAGVDNAIIDIDQFGKCATAVVNMITTTCTNVLVFGTMNCIGTTTGAKDIIDSAGSSTWYGHVYDACAGTVYSGGTNAAWAKDDVSVVASDLVVTQSDVKTILSNLVVAKSDIVAAISNISACKSDLVIIQASEDSDMVILKSDIAAVKSDLVVIQASEDSDMVVLKSDVVVCQSDIATVRKWLSDFIIKYTSDVP